MIDISSKLRQLKENLESAAFLVGKGDSEKQVHSEIIQSLILVSEIDATIASPAVAQPFAENDSHEIKKVQRRLKLWSRRPNQINSKILNAYLKLKRSGADIVTEQMLKSELPDESSFDSNFAQMKIIAEKNHGKIFDLHGEQVTLWPPIAQDVAEYEQVVFRDS